MDVEPVVVQNQLLRVGREVTVRDAGLAVTLRVTSRSRLPVTFQLYDPLPRGVAVDDIGFHPDHEPAHGHIDDGLVVVGGIVDPDETLTVVYGVCPQQPRTPADVEDLQAERRPSVEIDELRGPEADAEAELERATATRSPTDAEPASAGGGAPRLARLWAAEEAQAAPSALATNGDADRDDADGPVPEEAAVDDGGWIQDLFGDESPDAAAETADSEPAAPATGREAGAAGDRTMGDDPFGPADSDSELAAGIAREASSGSRPADESRPAEASEAEAGESEPVEDQFDGVAGRPDLAAAGNHSTDASGEPGGSDVIERVLQAFETGAVSDAQRRRLAWQLASVAEAEPSVARDDRLADLEARLEALEAMETRLEALEAMGTRLEALESGLASLEAVQREYDRLEETIDGLQETVSSLVDSVRQLESDRAAAAAERAVNRRRLDDIEETLSELDRQTDWLDERSSSRMKIHRAELDRLDRRLDELDQVSERVAELDREVAALSDAVERAERRRQAMLRAITEPDAIDR